MSKFAFPLIMAATMVLSACGVTKQLYEGPKKSADQVATLWRNNGAAIVAIRNANGEVSKTNPLVTRYEVLPGTYEILFEFKFAENVSLSSPYTVYYWYYKGIFDIRAGKNYSILWEQMHPAEFCLAEDALNAPGSKINPTGDLYTPSPNAIKTECARRVPVKAAEELLGK